jgi:predicted NAD/FAD-binding protein
MAQNSAQQYAAVPPDTRKRVLIVGAGAAGMSAAHHLAQHPDRFSVTVIDAVDRCGGQAFSVPLDRDLHGASWFNQGVQGGSYIFHHTLAMFGRLGFHADPVDLQVSFGKDAHFWTNVFPTQLLETHQAEVRRLASVLWLLRWFEVLFALLPLRLVLRLFLFSDEFINAVVLPMTALFLGTGNTTPQVPAVMFERLCTSPTYGMWYPPDKTTVASRRPPMVVFPNLSEFYGSWQRDLKARGVTVRLATELVDMVDRLEDKVTVRLRKCPSESHHVSTIEEFDDVILCCLADTAKKVLGKSASWRERRVLGAARFSDDLTVTHTDAAYMRKHYENFYRPDLAVATVGGADHSQRLDFAKTDFRPMYYTKTYPQDRRKLEMCFDATHYQSQFPAAVPFDQHVFQTIFLNRARDGALWTDGEIDPAKVVRKDWWHQLCHGWTHYLAVVPWMLFLQGRRRVRFAGSWTLVNAHEVAVLSGIAAAVDLGAEYPAELERDRFAFLCFRAYYLVAYGRWYRRKHTAAAAAQGGRPSEKVQQGEDWASGLYGSVYRGPGVAAEERTTWREEMVLGRSTQNMM